MKGHTVNDLLFQLLLVILAFDFFDFSNAGFGCVNNPCINGICIDDLNSTYSCYCVDGYTGVHCQTNWDECWSAPCLNGGTCYDGIASYTCLCTQGYSGKNCEVDIDECISNPCQNNATCFDQRNGYICVCIPGYSGTYCEVDLAVCNNTEEMQCFNNGLCVEGPGLTYTCECQPGWTGKLCEEQVDECASIPCQNGAICIDHQATYSCACLFGFTGHNCEFELQLCEMNLCKNDAICIIENDTRACYCVPDYHGEKCQFQYDECQLAVRCMNGGTCIDGVDNYTCSCPLKTTGTNCECIIQSDGKIECELYVTQMYNDTETTQEPFTPFYTTFSHDEPEITSKTEMKDISTDTMTKFSDESNTSETTPSYTMYHSTTEFTTDTTIAEYSTTIKEFTTQYEIDVSTEETFTSSERSTSVTQITLTDEQETTEIKYITTESSSPDILTITDASTTTIYYEITSPVEQTIKWTDRDITTTDITGTEIDTLSSTSIEERTITEEPDQTGSYTSVESTLSTFDTTMREITSSVDITTEQATMEVTENDYCIDIYNNCTTKVMQTENYPTHISILNTTFINETDTTENTIFDINCSFITCLNGGTCYVSQRGPKCSCKFGWDGAYCQETVEIKVAAFTGKSFLVHKLENNTSIIVSLNLRTLSNSGIILYAQITPEMYMCLHLQNGFLKFQFSCGIQTMLFSEMKYRVNTGYHVSLLATLSMTEKDSIIQEGVCNAALRINDTVAMSGEQTATITSSQGYSSYLYIGGLPFYLVQQIDLPVTSGITGCINQLKIDGIDRNIYADAVDGLAISECSSLACLSNPCYNEATCVENGNMWNCLCPSGYVGDTCEQSVCANNLCNFGATCVQHPSSGFLCLCPLGKHGLFCQYDVEIDQPTFSSTIRGWSSFAGYNVPIDALVDSFQLKFKFIPETIEQISLLIFVGQSGKHSSTSDHLAISFIKGYIALTWNLGGGPRRIFTPHAIAKKPKKAHSIVVGRTGPNAWLLVEGFKNITGKSNSRYTKLNVTPTIYVGGHESYNFATLPNDIPLHMGFSGCLYDMELNVGHITLGLQKKRPAIGRSVAQCGTSECHNYTCQHAGACVQHGSSLACLCPDGWFGPICAHRYNLCDSNRHKCASGSTCVPLSLTYECDCPVGVTGKFCDKIESQLSDVSFSGIRSFLSLNSSWDFQTKQFIVEFQLRPQSDTGLILFVQSKQSRFFISLSLWGGVMEFRVLTSGNSKKSDQDKELIIVKSGKVIPIEEWTKVKFGRFGQKVYLSVNGMTNAGLLPTNSNLPLQNATIYFGGLEDLSDIPRGALPGLPTSYKGCLRQFSMNYKKVALYQQHIKNGRNIADCDGTLCGGEICENGGSCWLNISLQPHCICPEEYVGERCETLISCKEVACKNNGRCVIDENKPKCHCPLGWIGPFCEKEMPVGIPLFKGDGYLVLEKPHALVKRHQSILFNKNTLEYIQVQFSTTEKDGLILWTSLNEDYFGIGVENYCIKVVWAWQQQEENFHYNTTIDDGNWHSITAEFTTFHILLRLDNETVYQKNHTIHDYLHTDGLFYLGGHPNHNVSYVTQNAFTNNFAGCISELSWKEYTIKSFKKHKGENVETCDIY